MTLERVLLALSTIGDYTDEDIAKYTPLAQHNLSLYNGSYDEDDESKVCYLVAAKTNYDIALISAQSGVKSFTAGDVRVESRDYISVAKEIYDSALQECSSIANDTGFCFRSV